MSEPREPLPLVILAGSDEHRCVVPDTMQESDMLEGHKGAIRLPSGRPLAGEVVRRFLDSGRFREPILVGPASVYGSLGLDCEVVDAAGDLASILERAMDAIGRRFEPRIPVAVTACDILPSADELAQLLDEHYEPNRECVFWGQLARAASPAMGASSWKPGYGLVAEGGRLDVLYPGHLVIVRPEALRIKVTTRLLHLAYRHRNMPLLRRAIALTLKGLGVLADQDLRSLLALRPSALTISIPFVCWSSYLAYQRGRLSVAAFEKAVTHLFVYPEFRRRNAARPVVFAVTDILSLAKDLDTKGELTEAIREQFRSPQEPGP